jgi:ribonuclease P protein component
MLATAHRLRRRGDFTSAVRAGQRAGRTTLVVHLQHRDADAPPRAGFVVSRAVGGAVTRNRVQRRLRHLVRDRIDQLPAGSMLVVRALPAAATATYVQLAEDLATALRSAARKAEAAR